MNLKRLFIQPVKLTDTNMTISKSIIWLSLIIITIMIQGGCKSNYDADAVYYNGTVYSVDELNSVFTAFAVKAGKIIALGTDEEMLEFSAPEKTDLKGKTVIPGFHDGHCHFYGYGLDLKKIWLTQTESFEEVLEVLQINRNRMVGGWIFGRGWDQNKWPGKSYPDNSKLDSLFPDIPVFLLRVDGHAALANSKALQMAGINASTVIDGGLIEKKKGRLTGILLDNAADRVSNIIPEFSYEDKKEALLNAQRNCFEVGITSVTDAGIESSGLTVEVIRIIDSLQQAGDLKMRINAMAAPEEIEHYRKNGKIKTERLSVHGFKVYSDGALGSRGACLLEPYSDQSEHSGFLIHSPEALDSIVADVASISFQLNTHSIGDSSHRLMLQLYGKHTTGLSDHRWRIEHAQVIHPDDFELYKKYKIIPSVQPVHATSDMYWAGDRLGPERVKGAYAYKQLFLQNNIIISGSDFPVEPINPLFGLYAAVARMDQKGYPEGGFQPENALTREEALRSFTLWPAYGAFREKETGSLQPGKTADFVILDEDIMTIPLEKIWQTKVLSTYVSGENVFQRE